MVLYVYKSCGVTKEAPNLLDKNKGRESFPFHVVLTGLAQLYWTYLYIIVVRRQAKCIPLILITSSASYP